MPATTPTKKNIIINHGLVSNQLSKINPIIVPTNTAATNSVLNLKACPILDVWGFSFSTFNFLRAFLGDLLGVLYPFRQPCSQLFQGQLKLAGLCLSLAWLHHKVYSFLTW